MRSNEEIVRERNLWLKNASALALELEAMNANEIEDAFYSDLSFGTGGLRGVLGAGTNRMNVYTVAKATQGLASHLKKTVQSQDRTVAISYDSRINSDLFSRVASEVFAANGFQVRLYPELMPVPCLSFAVRHLSCCAGVMITASHNPSKYNGYKVYGADGCQITTQAAKEISEEISRVDTFAGVERLAFDQALAEGKIRYIASDTYDAFTHAVKDQSALFGDEIDRNVAIVYTPLNGAGLKPVTRVLRESGFKSITVVAEQEQPDGNFPTCPYPNPEIREAMRLGLEYCRKANADLLIATDPDCDRCGIAVKDDQGEYQLLSGNEVGLLLLDWICSQRLHHQKMPKNPVFVKTIVTTDLAEKIAASYGVETVNVLTGFKFIGEIIGKLEQESRLDDYICGFEESYGYLTGTYVRDKDGVNATLMIAEMFAFYKTRGVSLLQKLNELYGRYGYCLNTLHSYEFAGSAGMTRMKKIMAGFRNETRSIGCYEIADITDYSKGVGDLPKSDVIKFRLKNGSGFVARPSGTEPKLKIYCSVLAGDSKESAAQEKEMIETLEEFINRN